MHSTRNTLLLLLALSFLISGCSGSRKQDEEVDAFLRSSASFYIKKGSDAVDAGRYSEAVPLFRQAVALTPYDPVAHNDLGVAFYHLGQLDSALAYYQAAIRLRPDYLRAISNLSKTYADLGDKNYALAAAERIIELAPSSTVGYLLQAEIYEKHEQYDEAIQATLTALALDSTQKDLLNNLGVIYFRSGRLGQAISCYEQVLGQDSTYAVAYFNLGNVLARKCLLEEAQYNYKRALHFKPDMTSAANNHGLVHLFMGRLEEAKSDFRRALAADSTAPAALYNLSIVQMRLDSLDRALASIERAITLKPAVANFFLQEGNILQRLGRAEEALAAMQKAVALDSTLSAGYNSLGNLMVSEHPDLATEAYEKAVANYDEYMQRRYGRSTQVVEKGYFDLLATCKERTQIRTDHALIYTNLGESYLRLGNYEQAGKAFRKAHELQPDLWQPAENLAVMLISQKREGEARAWLATGRLTRARAALLADSLEAAEKMLREAAQLQPGMQGSHELLARLHERRGDAGKAENSFKSGVKLYPGDAAIRQAYGRFLSRQGRFSEAKAQLLEAIALDPKRDEAHYQLATIYRTLGETQRADQEVARSHHILGEDYEEAGFFDRAMEEYQLAAAADPDRMEYVASQGIIYLKRGLYKDAEHLFTRALEKEEKNALSLYGMGVLNGERKEHKKAVEWLQSAIAVQPDNGQFHQALAVNYWFLGQPDSARAAALTAQKLGVTLHQNFLKAIDLPAPLR